MIKVLISLLVLAWFVAYGAYWFKYNYLEDGSFLTTPAYKAKAVWRIESAGDDARVYEFSPRSDPSKTCVVWAGTNKAGMECW